MPRSVVVEHNGIDQDNTRTIYRYRAREHRIYFERRPEGIVARGRDPQPDADRAVDSGRGGREGAAGAVDHEFQDAAECGNALDRAL